MLLVPALPHEMSSEGNDDERSSVPRGQRERPGVSRNACHCIRTPAHPLREISPRIPATSAGAHCPHPPCPLPLGRSSVFLIGLACPKKSVADNPSSRRPASRLDEVAADLTRRWG